MVYIKDEHSTTIILKYANNYCNCLVLDIPSLKLILVVIYRPPDCPSNDFATTINNVEKCINSVGNPTPNILMFGDFNFPRIDWNTETSQSGGTRIEQDQSKCLLKLTNMFFLQQIIQQPTRGKNILDLVFTNDLNLIHHYHVTPTIFSDHNIININLGLKCLKSPDLMNSIPTPAMYNYNKADWMAINNKILSMNWDELFRGKQINEKCEILLDAINNLSNTHIPTKRPSTKSKSTIPRDRKILMRNRKKVVNKIHEATTYTETCSLLTRLHNIETQIKNSHKNERHEKEQKAVAAIKDNPKYFYSYASQYSATKTTIGPFLGENNEQISDPSAMAELLQTQYKSAFSIPYEDKLILNPEEFFSSLDTNIPNLQDFDFSENDIISAIDKIKNSSAPGPDRLSSTFLKQCKHSLAHPIYLLWRESLDCGQIPSLLKTANVTPIYKGGSKAIPKNYRPISLTSHLSKIFERVVRTKLVQFLENHKLLNDTQHGFRSGRSCLSQLLAHYDKIIEYVEDGSNVDVIYLDFAKAFDKVDHGILARKLRTLGIGGKVGSWINQFLTARVQTVVINGTSSSTCCVKSSVPQGTVLGPILFIILLLDINEGITSVLSSFADDTRVLKSISSHEHCKQLQMDLDSIYKWQTNNNMLFNEDKFELLRYGRNEHIKEFTDYQGPNQNIINEKSSVKDLGVTMSNNLTFTEHINKVCNKVKQLCGWILRTFKSRSMKVLKPLWVSLVQPHIDYCSQLWAPHKSTEIAKLEGLLRTYTNYIQEVKHLNFWARLNKLNMNSIQRRMERYRIIYSWKMIEDVVPNFGIQYYTRQRLGRFCRIPKINNSALCSIQTLKESSFTVKGPQLFNILPQHLRDLTNCSVLKFKTHLDTFLKLVPDEPRVSGYTQMCQGQTNSLLHQVHPHNK